MNRRFCLDAHLCNDFLNESLWALPACPTGWLCCLPCAAVMSCATTTFAAVFTQNYGNFMGTTVTFVDVTETNNENTPAAALFGPPIPSGNSIDFNPIGFDAAASGAGGNDLTDGQLTLMIEGKIINGVKQPINNVKISEIGDTTLVGASHPGDDDHGHAACRDRHPRSRWSADQQHSA